MRIPTRVDSPQSGVVAILNQLFMLESKIQKITNGEALLRNVGRMKEQFEAWGYTIENPSGQPYDETRTDCDASIAGESTENLVIAEVVKPLIRYRDEIGSMIAQRAVVVVRDRNSL